MDFVSIISFGLFLISGISQITYSNLALKLQNRYGVELKLRKFSNFSYSSKYLRKVMLDSKNNYQIKLITKILILDKISIFGLLGAILVFIVGNII